jgi:hypothetical protein
VVEEFTIVKILVISNRDNEGMRHCYIRAVYGGLRKVRNSLYQSRDHFYVEIVKWVKRNNSCREFEQS